jgi:hypothetical protein
VIPIVSYQVEALAQMSSTGLDLVDTASKTAAEADYQNIDQVDGRFDTAKIAALGPPLRKVTAALDDAQAETDSLSTAWLLPPIHQRFDQLQREVRAARDQTATAMAAVAVAPALLGAEGPRHYFIAFTTPAESRGLGGFMGNWAELTADRGKLELTRTGRSLDLAPEPGDASRTIQAPSDYLTRYGPLHPETEVRDVTMSPDFPSVAQAVESIYPQTRGGGPLDGVIAIDPYALASMLKITGPISVAGVPEILTADNAADYLLRRQYLAFGQTSDRVDALDDVAHQTFEQFIHTNPLHPSELASVLGPMVTERRLLASALRPDEEEFIKRLGLGGAFPSRGKGDFFGLVTQNAGNNKIDVFLSRQIDYQATFDPATGAVETTATIVLRNDAPSTGLPENVIANRASSGQPKGANWMWFNFYSPHSLQSATLDGEALSIGAQREFDMNVYQAFLAVPSQGSTKIVLRLGGSIDPSPSYEVGWYQQPTVNTDRVSVSLDPVEPWTLAKPEGAGATQDGASILMARESTKDDMIRVDLTRPDRGGS